jgi:hypothetical protein
MLRHRQNVEQLDRDIVHAAPNQNGNDILRHDLARGVRVSTTAGRLASCLTQPFPRAQKARHIPSKEFHDLNFSF